MTRRAIFFIVACILAGAHPLAAQQTSAVRAPASAALRAEVTRLNEEMVAAFQRGDRAAVARFYADDARIVGPRRRVVQGREAIDRYWASIGSPAEWRLEVVEVGGSPDEAYQLGVSTLTSPGRDGTPDTYTCDFVVIWKRQPDGRLRITLDQYN
jgi:ketosteroid isomerase-like protein